MTRSDECTGKGMGELETWVVSSTRRNTGLPSTSECARGNEGQLTCMS
jgi:hypothetical protein